MIKPTVGRIVHYFTHQGDEEQAAIISKVIDDHKVNLGVFYPSGHPLGVQEVHLVQPGEDPPMGEYCQWMPYQVKKDTGSESGEKEAGEQVI